MDRDRRRFVVVGFSLAGALVVMMALASQGHHPIVQATDDISAENAYINEIIQDGNGGVKDHWQDQLRAYLSPQQVRQLERLKAKQALLAKKMGEFTKDLKAIKTAKVAINVQEVAPGKPGAIGPPGPVGVEGLVGKPGVRGPRGLAGPRGATGPTGPQGFPGPRGYTGKEGARGRTGIQGPVGAKGMPGKKGPTGATGIDGAPGSPGAPGLPGNPGNIGSQGPPGPPGPSGNPGKAGPDGLNA